VSQQDWHSLVFRESAGQAFMFPATRTPPRPAIAHHTRRQDRCSRRPKPRRRQ